MGALLVGDNFDDLLVSFGRAWGIQCLKCVYGIPRPWLELMMIWARLAQSLFQFD
jgi:hypothetical protein